MGKSELPVKRKDGIFSRIRNFLFGLFSKKKKVEGKGKEPFVRDVSRAEFLDSIRMARDEERENLLTIQRKIESGEYGEEEILKLSNEDRKRLENLYSEQIEILEDELEGYKNRIVKVRNMLAEKM